MNAVEDESLWLADLPYLGVLRVSGQDRRTFLQGQLTQDIERLSPERSILSGWTSPKGRLLTIAQLFDWQGSIWLLMPVELIDDIKKRLTVYVLRSDVQLETPRIGIVGLGGTNTIEAMQSIGIKLANEPDAAESTETVCVARLAADPSRIVALGDMSGYPAATTNKRDSGDWRLLNIRSGIPTIFEATVESFLPQMVNLDLCGGVSFDKGCYTGQEIVARTHNLGRVKRRMFRFTYAAQTETVPAQTIFSSGRPVGHIVDAVSQAAGTEILAVVPLDRGKEPLALDESGACKLDRAPLPYDIPGLAD